MPERLAAGQEEEKHHQGPAESESQRREQAQGTIRLRQVRLQVHLSSTNFQKLSLHRLHASFPVAISGIWPK